MKNILIALAFATLLIVLIYQFKPKKVKKMETIPTNKADYIKFITPSAKVIQDKFGIPYQFIIAQTGLETAWGKSSLLKKYFNFGGIKARKNDPFIELETVEYINGQRKVLKQKFWRGNSVIDGLKRYAELLQLPRYKAAFKYKNDPYKFAEEIFKGGYATDPNYIPKIHSILKTI